MPDFAKIAPYLGNPLVVAAFGMFLAIGVLRLALSLKIFRQITAEGTREIVLRVLLYAFILALVALVGGFGLAAYRATSVPTVTSAAADVIKPLVEPKSVALPVVVPSQGPEHNEDVGHEPAKKVPHKSVITAPSPRATRIIEGHSDSPQSRLFNITIENPLATQITLDTWDIAWQYQRGTLASVEVAQVIKPSTEHSITLKIDPNNLSRRSDTLPVQPTIVMPSATPASPSLSEFRLELLYAFQTKPAEHRSADWNLVFSISIKTTEGLTIPLFKDEKWR